MSQFCSDLTQFNVTDAKMSHCLFFSNQTQFDLTVATLSHCCYCNDPIIFDSSWNVIVFAVTWLNLIKRQFWSHTVGFAGFAVTRLNLIWGWLKYHTFCFEATQLYFLFDSSWNVRQMVLQWLISMLFDSSCNVTLLVLLWPYSI